MWGNSGGESPKFYHNTFFFYIEKVECYFDQKLYTTTSIYFLFYV